MTSREQVRASTSDLRRDPLAVVVAAAMLVTSLGFAAVDAIDRESVELLAVVSLLGAVILVIRCLAVFGRATDLGLLVLLVGSVFWFYAPALSVAFSYEQWYQQAAHLIIDNRHALKAFVAVNLFVFMVTVGYCFGGSWALSCRLVAIVGRDEWPAQRRLIALMFTGAFGALLFYVGFSGGVGDAVEYILGSRTVKKPWDADGNYGTGLTPLHIICNGTLIFVASSGMYLLVEGRVRGWWLRISLALLALLCGAVSMVGSGTRSVTILILAPAVLLYFRHRIAGAWLAGAHRVLVLCVIGAVAAVVANAQLSHRSGLEFEGVPAVEVQHNDFFTKTAFGFAAHDRLGRYIWDSALLLIVSGPVPRVLWPGKPESEVVVVFSDIYWGRDIKERGGNTMPSVLGQYYMSWGWFGVAEVGFVLGWLVRTGDKFARLVKRGSPLLVPYALFLAYLFVGFRFLGLNFFTPAALSVVWTRVLTSGSHRVRARAFVRSA